MDTAGTVYYDANYYAVGEAGNPHFENLGANEGGLALKDGNGWCAVLSTNNMNALINFTVAQFYSVNATNGITISGNS